MASFCYKPGPAHRAYYEARQRFREGHGEVSNITALYLAMIAEREAQR